jgi:ABC-2 type transport system permease protein
VTILRRWLIDRRRGLAGWSLGVTGLVLFTVGFFPTVRGNEAFDQLTDQLPAGIRDLVGLTPGAPITAAPGYLHARLFSTLVPLLLLVYAIGLGSRAIAGTEEEGTLELLLAHPVTRPRVVVERYVANTALLVAVTAVLLVALVASGLPLGALDGVSWSGLAGAVTGAFAIALLHCSIAYAVGAGTGRRGTAIAAATAVAVAGYLVEGLQAVSDVIHPFRYVTPWHWYLGRNMLTGGPAPDAIAVPLVLSAVLLAASVRLFSRRDLR